MKNNLGHHGLSCGGVSGNQDGLVVLQAQHRPGLEGVQSELVGLGGLPGLKYQHQVRSEKALYIADHHLRILSIP